MIVISTKHTNTHAHVTAESFVYKILHTHKPTFGAGVFIFTRRFTACFYSLQYKVPKLRVSQFTSPNSVSSFLTHTLHSAHQGNVFNSWPASTSRLYLLHHAYSSDSFSSSCLPPRPCYSVFTAQYITSLSKPNPFKETRP